MTETKPHPLHELAAKLGHTFARMELLESALTHPSLGAARGRKKSGVSAYERLEFLGDRVLGLVIAHWLYQLFPNSAEGDLAKRHAALVNRDALRVVAIKLDLDLYLRLIHGDQNVAPRQNLAAMSDATEAVIGAMYLDGGLAPAERFIKSYWDDVIHAAAAPADPKTVLQEWAQGHGLPLPTYTIVDRQGPAHAPVFTIEVSLQGHDPIRRTGPSKREAEKDAAQALYKEITKK